MRDNMTARRLAVVVLGALAAPVAVASCSDAGRSPPPPPPCELECRDKVAVRAMRESLKLLFNLTLQGKPVGKQDQTVPCPKGGRARVFGEATSNAIQGSTEVHLTFVLEKCGYSVKVAKPEESYSLTTSGTIQEDGTIAVQPSSTTALIFKSDGLTIDGTVYDGGGADGGAYEYKEEKCRVELGQNGNKLSGTLCTRVVGLDL